MVIGLMAAAFVSLASAQNAGTGHPGIVNYIEGQVTVNGALVAPNSAGSTDVGPNQVLEAQNGKAEILLTPGVFLRVGNNSAVRMLSPDLTNTRVELLRGEALVEVTELYPQNHLQIVNGGATTDLLKTGVYGFNAARPEVVVYDGKAAVEGQGSEATLKKGKEAALTTAPLKAVSFNRKETEKSDDLYQWSSLRSEYLAEASWDSARTIVVNSDPWWGAGWYWNPYWDMYSFIPGDGFMFSPFGWGFYSPWTVWRAPYYGRGGMWGRGVMAHGAVPHGGAFADRPMGRMAPSAGFHSFGGGGFGGGGFGGGHMGGGMHR